MAIASVIDKILILDVYIRTYVRTYVDELENMYIGT